MQSPLAKYYRLLLRSLGCLAPFCCSTQISYRLSDRASLPSFFFFFSFHGQRVHHLKINCSPFVAKLSWTLFRIWEEFALQTYKPLASSVRSVRIKEDSLWEVVFKRTLSPFLQDNSVEEDRLLMFPQVSVTLLPSSNVFSSVAEMWKIDITGDIHVLEENQNFSYTRYDIH